MRKAHPFDIHAFVVLPEHLHCVLQLPEGDSDFTLRWRLIKEIITRNRETGPLFVYAAVNVASGNHNTDETR
jgi:REP element-mobilizing transposase RayT